MRWKNWLPLAVAIVFGVLAAKVARDMIVSGKATAVAAGEMVDIVVAATDIAPGTELSAELLTTSHVPAEHVPKKALRNFSDVVGGVAAIEIPKGTEIVAPMLAAGGSGTGLQALVPPGMRAISLEVNEFSGVGGMLAPGSRVDVLVTLAAKEAGGEPVSRTIVQNVKVTAVGQRLTRANDKDEDQNFKSVTLVTTPEQAEAIELATTNGRPRLVLRSGRDNVARESNGVRLAELRGNLDTVAAAPVTVAVAPVTLDPKPFVDPFAPTTRPAPTVVADPGSALARRLPVQLIQGGVEKTVMVDDFSATAGAREAFTGNVIEP